MNKLLHRKTAYALRTLLEKEETSGYHQAAEAYIYAVMTAASEAAGLPVSAWWQVQDILQPPPVCYSEEVLSQASLLLAQIPPEDWNTYPELAGWMYQYMLEERKDVLFKGFKKGSKARHEDIPAVTQLFTPGWIARYMAENAVGRLWLECFPRSSLTGEWRYFDRSIDTGEGQGPASDSNEQEVTGWKVLDPACGCGHLLTAAFDVLMDIYREAGVAQADAIRYVLNCNLYGLDIDPQAVRISRFVLLLKAASIDRSIIYERINWGIAFIPDNGSRTFGSLERPELCGKETSRINCSSDGKASSILAHRYHAVLTNPPYLGRRNMDEELADFLDKKYPRSRSDLFAAFMDRCLELLVPGGYHAAINQHSWMYLSGYEDLRSHVLKNASLISLLHLGARAFDDNNGEVVQTVSFILRNEEPSCDWRSVCWRLTEETSSSAKEAAYLQRGPVRQYIVRQQDFDSLPGKRIAYELPVSWISLFQETPSVDRLYAVKKGMDTGCNDSYVRYWHEVPSMELSFRGSDSSKAHWFPYAKGGGSRKWYGNHYYVVRWTDNGRAIKQDPRSNLRNARYYGRPGITWSTVSTGSPGFRLLEEGFLFDNGGSCLFPLEGDAVVPYATLAYLNSRFISEMLRQMNPTLNIQPGDVARLPLNPIIPKHPELELLGEECVMLSRQEWDESERSWNFTGHPVIGRCKKAGLEESVLCWRRERGRRESRLKHLEREIDRVVYRIYGLQPLVVEHVEEQEDISVKDDLKTLLSYAAGCMMDYYPLNGERLFAEDPVVMLGTDIVPRFKRWLLCNWPSTDVHTDFIYIASLLGSRRKETAEERITRYFIEEWYEEHKRLFDGKPLYLKVSSGGRGGIRGFVPALQLNCSILKFILDTANESLLQMYDGKSSTDYGSHDNANSSIRDCREIGEELQAYVKQLESFLLNPYSDNISFAGMPVPSEDSVERQSETDFFERSSRLIYKRYAEILANN
jgi:hypothetical protein